MPTRRMPRFRISFRRDFGWLSCAFAPRLDPAKAVAAIINAWISLKRIPWLLLIRRNAMMTSKHLRSGWHKNSRARAEDILVMANREPHDRDEKTRCDQPKREPRRARDRIRTVRRAPRQDAREAIHACGILGMRFR